MAIRCDWRSNSVLIVHTMTSTPRELRLAVGVVSAILRAFESQTRASIGTAGYPSGGIGHLLPLKEFACANS